MEWMLITVTQIYTKQKEANLILIFLFLSIRVKPDKFYSGEQDGWLHANACFNTMEKKANNKNRIDHKTGFRERPVLS